MKRSTIMSLTLTSILILSAAGMLGAQGVLKTDLASPQQVVKTRKYLMHTIKLNSADAAKKFEADQIGDMQANGAAIALAAKVMPPLYKEKHEIAYDGKGKFFKGGEATAFEAACEAMRVASQGVRMNAEKGDKAGVASAMGVLQKSCGACHNAYRGSF